MKARAVSLGSAVCVLAVVAASGVVASSAEALPANCSQAGATVTCTFTATGATQTFTPPAGVSSIAVSLTGGQGGAGGDFIYNGFGGGSGGLGASVSGSVAVTGGQPLTLYVGSAGSDGGFQTASPGGFGDGAGGGGGGRTDSSSYASGGGGGGASALVDGTTPLAVAGGGGGGGGGGVFNGGGNGGASGGGGEQSSDGGDGAFAYGLGGGGGGGGGGLLGGSGGANGGNELYAGYGGSGGTDLVPAGGTVSDGVNAQDGSVTISYQAPFAGTPGRPNCVVKTVSALNHEYNGNLFAAAKALGFKSVTAMLNAIMQYCGVPAIGESHGGHGGGGQGDNGGASGEGGSGVGGLPGGSGNGGPESGPGHGGNGGTDPVPTHHRTFSGGVNAQDGSVTIPSVIPYAGTPGQHN